MTCGLWLFLAVIIGAAIGAVIFYWLILWAFLKAWRP